MRSGTALSFNESSKVRTEQRTVCYLMTVNWLYAHNFPCTHNFTTAKMANVYKIDVAHRHTFHYTRVIVLRILTHRELCKIKFTARV